ncbi:MAG TPA: glycosyltransferase family 39 protein [Patescibacteria group bacterium]
MAKIKLIILGLVFVIAVIILFSHQLLETPMGLTVDETAFGYNAALLSRTGHDENNRFLPLFVLSINGQDWRQPLTQYYLALLFHFFTPSVWLLRFSSIIITIVSSFLLVYLAFLYKNFRFSLFSIFVFITTPLIMIQSHLGLDNIMPIPFTILWLLGLLLFTNKRLRRYLILSAIALGISYYSYKGMRAVSPVWAVISVIYLSFINKHLFSKKNITDCLYFGLTVFPFFAATPYLNHLYPGAMSGGASPHFDTIYNFFYPYLSSFDLTFLFIKGDELPYHSTGIHGMMLLASLPFFIYGIKKLLDDSKPYSRFLVAVFFSAPLLFGIVNSVHRASRLMCLIPVYALITAFGLECLTLAFRRYRVIFLVLLLSLFSLNYIDFLHYYWNDYTKLSQSFVGDLKPYLSYQQLHMQSQKLNLTPYISSDIYNDFFASIYFSKPLIRLNPDDIPPTGSILLTQRKDVPDLSRLDLNLKYYYLQTR